MSFCCQPAQVFGLLGINGAGKSNCLRLPATRTHTHLTNPGEGGASVLASRLFSGKVRLVSSLAPPDTIYEMATILEPASGSAKVGGCGIVEQPEKARAQIFGSACVYAAPALTAAVARFKRERVLFRT